MTGLVHVEGDLKPLKKNLDKQRTTNACQVYLFAVLIPEIATTSKNKILTG
jgi:hypothetical protein